MNNFYNAFKDHLARRYPETLRRGDLSEMLSPHLISPMIISLPLSVAQAMEKFVSAYWKYTQNTQPEPKRPENGACTSFDFHVQGEEFKLIEVNTNASLSLVFSELQDFHQLKSPWKNAQDKILRGFETELKSFQSTSPPTVAIVDQNIFEQKMRLEFFLFAELFKRNGWKSLVLDVKDLHWNKDSNSLESSSGQRLDLVYNRLTDFYLSQPTSAELLKAYLSKVLAITPNPYNYKQLADKRILCNLTRLLEQGDKPRGTDQIALSSGLLKTFPVKDFSGEELWNRRKEFFFKPVSSFGSKGVYKGKSISRKIFDNILAGDYLAQEIFPPALWPSDESSEPLKFDVRLITYATEVQVAGARLYRGQLTNFQSPDGGAAAIHWT